MPTPWDIWHTGSGSGAKWEDMDDSTLETWSALTEHYWEWTRSWVIIDDASIFTDNWTTSSNTQSITDNWTVSSNTQP